MAQSVFDRRKMAALVSDVSEDAAQRAAQITARRCQTNVIAAGRVDTGALAVSFRVTTIDSAPGTDARFLVYTMLHYAPHQEWGTRGSQAAPGHVLRFRPKGSGSFIFRPRSGPITGAFFMKQAVERLRVDDFLP